MQLFVQLSLQHQQVLVCGRIDRHQQLRGGQTLHKALQRFARMYHLPCLLVHADVQLTVEQLDLRRLVLRSPGLLT